MSHYILVHGVWEESGMWDNVSPILRRSGHTVTAVDLPGHGANKNSVSQTHKSRFTARSLRLSGFVLRRWPSAARSTRPSHTVCRSWTLSSSQTVQRDDAAADDTTVRASASLDIC